MIHEQLEIKLACEELGLPPSDPARLITYVQENSEEIDPNRRRPAIVICPGGGYEFLSEREAQPVALQFVAMGYQCFVLRYAVAPARFPVALLQLMEAVSLVRGRAAEWHVDPGKVAVMGFSAGGHLAASAGCLSRESFCAAYGLDAKAVRPDRLLLCYPVISAGPKAHQGSIQNLTGGQSELRELACLERQVTADTPPTFLWHTFDDDVVPVENSLLFASALREKDVPFELHIYPRGVHGLALSTPETLSAQVSGRVRPECSGWVDLADTWLKSGY